MGDKTLIQAKTQYSPPKLSGQKAPYKGRRYLVIEMDKNLPYSNYENACDALVYDKLHAAKVAFITYLNDGALRGDLAYGQGTTDMYGKNYKDLVSEAMRL
jgi:hypothetical protein